MRIDHPKIKLSRSNFIRSKNTQEKEQSNNDYGVFGEQKYTYILYYTKIKNVVDTVFGVTSDIKYSKNDDLVDESCIAETKEFDESRDVFHKNE